MELEQQKMEWALILNLCQHLNLLLLLSIFHPSLRQAERAKLQVLVIIKCSILIVPRVTILDF